MIGLTGCSQKPPGCADAEVQSTMREMLVQPIPSAFPGIDASEIAELAKEVKLVLTNVVSEGYQADAKKQMCRATLEIQHPDGKKITPEVVYATQMTVDKPGSFMLTVENADALRVVATSSLPFIIHARRWTGKWAGDLVCSASSKSSAPDAGAFTERITANMNAGKVNVELSGREGITLLTGSIEILEPVVQLSSEGRDAQPAHTSLRLGMKPQGALLSGTAEYVDKRWETIGQVIRRCTVSMTKDGSSAGVAAAPPSDQKGWPGTYTGEGDGEVTLEVKQPGSDNRFPVSLSTNTAKTGGGCGGAVQGFATEAGNELRIVAEADGQRCEAVAKRSGSGVELEEGAGCNYFHGAACGFSATLIRKP
ncbi:MAG: hypothetical protein J0L58_13755 [Burkholderiales bacterium]|nr:hypothetical protein [Burkholderiales bacterium]